MSNCVNCNKELISDHAFCPNCGHDLRQYQTTGENKTTQTLRKEKSSILNRLGSPNASIWISFFTGAIVMEMINGQLTRQDASIASLIGSILGAGAGFFMLVLAPSVVISLIGYAIRKKFPWSEFVILIYVFTVLASCLFLYTLF